MDKVIRSRLQWLMVIVGLCLLPSIFAIWGVDFSSVSEPSAPAMSDGADIQQNSEELFYLLAGALHHALLEWTAVSLALVVAAVSLLSARPRS